MNNINMNEERSEPGKNCAAFQAFLLAASKNGATVS